jgi:DNA-binding CsgD family transcriptional regulator
MHHNKSTNFENSLLNQVPGLLACVDENCRFTYMNDSAVATFGFINKNEAIGTTMENIRCKAAENSKHWANQNNEVFENNTPVKALDIAPYAHNKILTLITNKPLIQNPQNGQMHVIAHCTEISHALLINISMAIANSDKKYRTNNNINQRSYQISKKFDKKKLSVRELECLFYLIRGKILPDIAIILGLSKRTVESYVVSIKNKFHCNSKSELVEAAIENNFINFIPNSLLCNNKINVSITLE